MSQLTREQVVRILGEDTPDDRTILAIIETGASEAELIEAYDRYVRGNEASIDLDRPPSPRVNEICNLLAEMDAPWDEEAAARE